MQDLNENFLPWLYQAIPLTQHMGIRQLEWQQLAGSKQLVADLYLSPLVNDKQTAFGGGLVGLATLLGWCFTTLSLRDEGFNCPVVIKTAEQSYLRPIQSDFQLVSSLAANNQENSLENFIEQYDQHQKASLNLQAAAFCQGVEVFNFQATYVALPAD